jgi:hypothetical protein
MHVFTLAIIFINMSDISADITPPTMDVWPSSPLVHAAFMQFGA